MQTSGGWQYALNTGGNILDEALETVRSIFVAKEQAKGQAKTAAQLAQAEAARQAGNTAMATTIVVGLVAVAALYFLIED